MHKSKIFSLQGIKMPTLTHDRIQELKLTPKGEMILNTDMEAFPSLLKMMETSLIEQLAQYELMIRNSQDAIKRKMKLLEMLDDHLYWEFAYHMMFIKWREQQLPKAS